MPLPLGARFKGSPSQHSISRSPTLSSAFSVINGAHCNGTDTSGCNQSRPTAAVGNSPQALGLNPNNHTVYVTNTDDNRVSVIDGNTCNGTNTTGYGQTAAIVSVGAAPRAIGVDVGTNTVFVGNRDDVTVSVIDGSTCNGTNTSGRGQTPVAVPVAAFPNVAPNYEYILGRGVAIDPASHSVFVPLIGDSDVVVINGRAWMASRSRLPWMSRRAPFTYLIT
jgi:DNA-binding beta-propeller fold protein YncE